MGCTLLLILNELLTILRRTYNLGITFSQWGGDTQQKIYMKSGKLNIRCSCKPGLRKAVATDLAKYKLDFAVVEELRLSMVGPEWVVDFNFFF